MNILHLTTILAAPISTKRRENDILVRLAAEYEKKYPGTRHHFIYITPYSNWFFALFKEKWKEYHKIIRTGTFNIGDYNVTVVGIPAFKNDILLRKIISWLGFNIFRKRINKSITNIKPDIIQAHNMHSCIELAELIKQKYGISYIVTDRSIEQRILNRIQKGRLLPSVVLSHNLISANRCKDLGIPLFLIPHPVDDLFINCKTPSMPTNENMLKIVSICGLVKRKNIDKVINALHNTKLEFSYTIFGDGPEKENLKNLVRSLNMEERVIFEGFKPHHILARRLPSFDLLMMPSFPETFGRVYFEAMACGVPVVASKNTGIDGMIEHQLHGYLVDNRNIINIEESIFHYVALSPEQKMKMKMAAFTFARQFTWEVVLEKYHALYTAYIDCLDHPPQLLLHRQPAAQ